jgi:hypothetical protein
LSQSWFFSENEELEERERESDLGEIRKWRDLKDDFSTFLISQKKKKKTNTDRSKRRKENKQTGVSRSNSSLSLLLFSINSSPQQCRRLPGLPVFVSSLSLLGLERFLFFIGLFQWRLESHSH